MSEDHEFYLKTNLGHVRAVVCGCVFIKKKINKNVRSHHFINESGDLKACYLFISGRVLPNES